MASGQSKRQTLHTTHTRTHINHGTIPLSGEKRQNGDHIRGDWSCSRNLSASDLKKTPTANFVIKYTAKMTDGALNSSVACELSARTYGPAEWWVLVEKDAATATSSAAGKQKAKAKGGKAKVQ